MKMTYRSISVSVAALGLQVLLLGGLASPVAADWREEAIVEAFEDVLDREPSDRELQRYRHLMEEEGWTERDVREDLREGRDDRRHSRHPHEDPEEVIRRAYDDLLHREPNAEGLREYRSRMIDDGWTERDVRDALRESSEYAALRRESAEEVVRRAFEDILGREPDPRGLASYRDQILNEGWDEQDVRRALRDSAEYRQKGQVTREQAEEIVRRAFEEVLGRDPGAGSEAYVDRVLQDHWTEEDVARELRNSDEYRSRSR